MGKPLIKLHFYNFHQQAYPHDLHEPRSETKTAEYCFSLVKESILQAESYHCHVVRFVSDNEGKMVNVRDKLREWKSSLIVCGCASHFMNLVQVECSPSCVMAPIREILKYFRDNHKASGKLSEADGLLPQLDNNTRWTSQRAMLDTFIRNHQR